MLLHRSIASIHHQVMKDSCNRATGASVSTVISPLFTAFLEKYLVIEPVQMTTGSNFSEALCGAGNYSVLHQPLPLSSQYAIYDGDLNIDHSTHFKEKN